MQENDNEIIVGNEEFREDSREWYRVALDKGKNLVILTPDGKVGSTVFFKPPPKVEELVICPICKGISDKEDWEDYYN